MSDFQQNGNIATLHNLRSTTPEAMSHALSTFAQTRKISLILPSLFSELEAPALSHIVDELAEVPYLHRIIIGLDRADKAQYRHAVDYFSRLPQDHIVIWNDSPRQKEIGKRLEAMGLGPIEAGKGKNVWGCLGYLMACQDLSLIHI